MRPELYSYRDYATGLYGFKDAQGVVAIPAAYTDVCDFDIHGRAAVMRDEMYGIIDEQGNCLTGFVFRYVSQYRFVGRARVAGKGYGYGYVDVDGRMVVPAVFDYGKDYDIQGYVSAGNNLYGTLDMYGFAVDR